MGGSLPGGKRLKFELNGKYGTKKDPHYAIKEVMTTYTLPETANFGPKEGSFIFQQNGIFRGKGAVSFREGFFGTRLWMTNISCRKTNTKLNAS